MEEIVTLPHFLTLLLMDDYRTTLLGRALADVLQEMEIEGTLAEAESDRLFELFDEVMLAEFAAAEPKKQPKKRAAASAAKTPPPVQEPVSQPPMVAVQLFTHDRMEITGGVHAFNRYMDKWNLHACVASDGIRLDAIPVDLTLPPSTTPTTELLVKLHDPRPQWRPRKKR